ncbi:hypothetical protein DFH06DRAFT_1410381 [Mycena polygramma]|nr:hypothetical protein DFH06DRAFT_1410381 [Mycena polygramma]
MNKRTQEFEVMSAQTASREVTCQSTNRMDPGVARHDHTQLRGCRRGKRGSEERSHGDGNPDPRMVVRDASGAATPGHDSRRSSGLKVGANIPQRQCRMTPARCEETPQRNVEVTTSVLGCPCQRGQERLGVVSNGRVWPTVVQRQWAPEEEGESKEVQMQEECTEDFSNLDAANDGFEWWGGGSRVIDGRAKTLVLRSSDLFPSICAGAVVVRVVPFPASLRQAPLSSRWRNGTGGESETSAEEHSINPARRSHRLRSEARNAGSKDEVVGCLPTAPTALCAPPSARSIFCEVYELWKPSTSFKNLELAFQNSPA